jgi:alpha-L-fucosidase
MKMNFPVKIILGILSMAAMATAQESAPEYVPETDSLVIRKLDQWQDLKFGLLMHWGTYSQWGIVESWSICAEDEGWCRRSQDDYIQYKAKYEKLKETFNPVNFDPDKWAKAAKQAGMKYVVFTTKHHDGFCMFDTRLTDYKITDPGCPFSSNPKANITREIFTAFRKQGLWAGAYFSKPDWHCPYYWWPNFATPDRNVNYDPAAYPDRWEKYIQYTHNQILELLSDYGPVDILWLDGGWVAPMSSTQIQEAYGRSLTGSPSGFLKSRIINQDIRLGDLVKEARAKQPGLIVVDRAVPGPYQNYLTPENTVPEQALPYPWESCIISGGGWSYTPDAKYRSSREVIHLLADIVSKGGNLLLNIAPSPDGTWQEEAYLLLESVGAWMQVNGKAIYGTRPLSPYKEGHVCLTQGKTGTIYAIYLADSASTSPPEKILLSNLHPGKGAKIRMLGAPGDLKWNTTGQGIQVEIPAQIRRKPPCRDAWVVEIQPNH